MDLIDLINSRTFLGSEFLMWLWFKAECLDGLFDIPNHDRVEVSFDDQLTLEAYLAETERNMFRGGAPAYSPEAKTALQEGKRVQAAKLRVVKEGREWTFKIKAETLGLTSVKIPSLLSKEEEEQFYERMYLVEELEEILDELYKEFLGIRLSQAWNSVMLPAIQKWVHTEELLNPDHYPSEQELDQPLDIPGAPVKREAETAPAE
ncbi:hypothetical protein FIV42_24255 [Persicimonas caeni]|uniref:Recombination-associated protein RdgC n=1 Tax=Persicimonas caeni TaxID=2292766 RepID=A0A4Y6PZP0_PERCE|nr:hypothetical protein [Persicimonas caeni]QDG53742.1 hypothetical protein FIV42_24255 [Persicimonas caeni]QED34963.1 hypothetical protein FRD00_24250 [Persicimonas caeni]